MRSLPSSGQALAIPHRGIHSNDDASAKRRTKFTLEHLSLSRDAARSSECRHAAHFERWTNTSNSAMLAAASTRT